MLHGITETKTGNALPLYRQESLMTIAFCYKIMLRIWDSLYSEHFNSYRNKPYDKSKQGNR